MPKLDWLRSFVTFSEHLNLTHAAKALHLSQPALYVQLRKLSDAVGAPLYRRVGRRLQLTPVGVRTERLGREVCERLDTFVMRQTERGERRPLVVAAGEGAFLYLLADPASALQREEPGLPLRLLSVDRDRCLDAVRHGRAHLGVTVLAGVPDDLDTHAITKVPPMLAVPAAHPLASRAVTWLSDLAGQPLIAPPTPRAHRLLLESLLADAGVTPMVTIEATGWPLVLRLVAAGGGLAIVNGCCHIPEGVVAIPIEGFPRTVYHLVTPPGGPLRQSARKLASMLISK